MLTEEQIETRIACVDRLMSLHRIKRKTTYLRYVNSKNFDFASLCLVERGSLALNDKIIWAVCTKNGKTELREGNEQY